MARLLPSDRKSIIISGSRSLKGYGGRSARERIERAVAELGYRPHPAARRLKSNRAEAIGVIATGPPNFGIWSILEGMTRGVRQAGFTLVIGQLDILAGDPDSPSEIEAAVDHLLLAGWMGSSWAPLRVGLGASRRLRDRHPDGGHL